MKRSDILTTVIVFSLVLVVVLAVVVHRGSNSLLEECPELHVDRLGYSKEQIMYWHENSYTVTKAWNFEEDKGRMLVYRHKIKSPAEGALMYTFVDGICEKIASSYWGPSSNQEMYESILTSAKYELDKQQFIIYENTEEKISNSEIRLTSYFRNQDATGQVEIDATTKQWQVTIFIKRKI